MCSCSRMTMMQRTPDDSKLKDRERQLQVATILSIQNNPSLSLFIYELHENKMGQTTLLYFSLPQKVDGRYLLHYFRPCRHHTDMIRSVLEKILLIALCISVLVHRLTVGWLWIFPLGIFQQQRSRKAWISYDLHRPFYFQPQSFQSRPRFLVRMDQSSNSTVTQYCNAGIYSYGVRVLVLVATLACSYTYATPC